MSTAKNRVEQTFATSPANQPQTHQGRINRRRRECAASPLVPAPHRRLRGRCLYSAAEELLEASADANEFDCVVADIYLPKMNGLQLQEELNRTIPYASIVFITGHGDLSLGMHAMRKGAVDFLEKPVDDQALLSSIARGADLSRQRRAERLQLIELEELQRSLTSREREVFALITSGLLNKQVAAELGTTERTVKAHRASVMNKMGADSLADLVRMAGVLQIHSG